MNRYYDFVQQLQCASLQLFYSQCIQAPGLDRNKGYGFIEYYNQACAEYAKQKMSTPEFKLDTNAPTVSWADPKNANEATSTAQVPLSTT